MQLTRRDLGRMAVAAATLPALASAKPNSRFGGVQIGVITYSFRSLPQSAQQVLGYVTGCGLSAIELMSEVPEGHLGAPQLPSTTEREKVREAMTKWRLSVPMSKYKDFRRMYEDAGVKIYAFKLPPTMAMSDAEYEYIWNAAETLGANHITMELPTSDELLQRVADYAAKRKLRIAFHTHGQGGSSGFEKALAASPYTALNLDVGHYYAVTGESPIPVMEKYAKRISSLHLKDRKGPKSTPPGAKRPGGPNMPFGQGDTPLKEILQTMKKRGWQFPGSVEYEYETPQGSDVLKEVAKCVQFCKNALA